MIIVTGAKRSGTSLWMQVLQAAGLPHIGTAFPRRWKESIGEANPEGFYESLLREGIYFRTNPHPKTGHYLFPESTRRHVVKVFVPGLIRSDRAYLDHVIVTVRPWREQCASIQALLAQEKQWLRQAAEEAGRPAPPPRRQPHPPEISWWLDHYRLIRDLAVRQYPYHLVSFDSLLDDPAVAVARALRFLGCGDLEGALKAVRPRLTRNRGARFQSDHLLPMEIEVMDTLVQSIHERRPLDAALLQAMNETQASIRARFPARARRRA